MASACATVNSLRETRRYVWFAASRMTSARAYTSSSRPASSTTGRAPQPGMILNASATEVVGNKHFRGRSPGRGDRCAEDETPLAAALAAALDSAPASGFPPPPGWLGDPRNPPKCPAHVPIGSAPIGCANKGNADGTPRKCLTKHASTSARLVRCNSCGTENALWCFSPACAPPESSPVFPSLFKSRREAPSASSSCVDDDGVCPRGGGVPYESTGAIAKRPRSKVRDTK